MDGYFYDPKEHIVLVSNNVVFLEDDYMMDQKHNDRFDFRELSDTPIDPLVESSNQVQDVPNATTSPHLGTLETRHSGRIIRLLTGSCS